MYYQNYEDYMRSILGYPVQNNMNCNTPLYNPFEKNLGYCNTYNVNSIYEAPENRPHYSNEIMELYPEIYKIVNPMVCKICEVNTKPITSELIEQMTDEIYLNLESDTSSDGDIINVTVNLPEENDKQSRATKKDAINNKNIQNNNNSLSKNIKDNRKAQENNAQNATRESISENRQVRRRNNTLRDLIKILILNRLLGIGRPQPRPPRPPMPYPPRSPFEL